MWSTYTFDIHYGVLNILGYNYKLCCILGMSNIYFAYIVNGLDKLEKQLDKKVDEQVSGLVCKQVIKLG